LIEYHQFHRVFIDYNPGKAVVDILRRMGYGQIVRAVQFGEKPIDPDKYIQKRSEMWDSVRLWLENSEIVSIPDDDALQKDLATPMWGSSASRYDEKRRLQVEEKEKIKKRLEGKSPDRGDALALTFAETVVLPSNRKRSWRDELLEEVESSNTGFMTS
jgi:hypothetical protein